MEEKHVSKIHCMFCASANEAKSIEHIVSESLGNKIYVAPKGSVCDACNGKFSKIESTALANTVFVMERSRLGIESKKGKNAKGKIGELEISGDANFRPSHVTVKGLSPDNLTDFDPQTGIGKLTVKSFDKSEVATSKLLLKMGLEAVYTSKKKIYDNFDFAQLRDFLLSNQSRDWPFLTSDSEPWPFISIPSFDTKYNLNKIPCQLKYSVVDGELIFKFKFGAIAMVISLTSRDLGWIKKMLEIDDKVVLYPDHFRNKVR